MNCCRNCFSSEYLKSFFFEKEFGDCDFCDSKNQPIVPPATFFNQFDALLSYYQVDAENGSFIETQIRSDFPNQIFREDGHLRLRELLQEIVKQDFDLYEGLFKEKIILSIKAEGRHLQVSATYKSTWEKFKEEIKFLNRFHITHVIDLTKLSTYFKKSLSKEISPGEIFYRGRISPKAGFTCDQLRNPPRDLAKAGRANPHGISYLYISDKIETSLYETRSTIYDYVTIGDFTVNEKLNIVDLRNITFEPILWAENEDLDEYLVYIPFLSTLQLELSLPVRSGDKEIDYLPTQYLTEFIKSLGYDGVKFQSSLYKDGFNLAVFNPSKLECKVSKVYEIKNIIYEFYSIDK